MIHPVLLGLRYIPLGAHSVGVFFIPSTKYIATSFGIFALAFMILLMILTLYIRMPYRIWLWSHKGLALVYILICLHVLYQPNDISNHFLIRWYLILIMVAGLAAVTYRTFLPNVLVRRYLYIIKTVEKKATGVIEITLTPINQEMQYKEGQFIFISFHADGLSSEWHPFTIASAPGKGSISIDVKSLGPYTETITRLLPSMAGMAVSIEGAYGRFSYRNFHNVNQVWIAGGIGITPFISMAQSLGSGNYNIDLYYSVKSEAELIDLDILASKQSNKPNQVFRTIPFVNDKYKGFLSADIIKANSGDLHGRDFLICGPPPMMNTIKKQLLGAGVSKYKIHTEEFSIT
jgi:predicted ferric reductase